MSNISSGSNKNNISKLHLTEFVCIENKLANNVEKPGALQL